MPVFIEMLGIAIVNSWICECFSQRNENARKQKPFREEVVLFLCGTFTRRKRPGRPSEQLGTGFEEMEHRPKKREARGYCACGCGSHGRIQLFQLTVSDKSLSLRGKTAG